MYIRKSKGKRTVPCGTPDTGRILAFPVSVNMPEAMMICHMFYMWLSNFRLMEFPSNSYAVLLQYRAEFPSRVGYQLGDVSDRFPKISIGGLKEIFPL